MKSYFNKYKNNRLNWILTVFFLLILQGCASASLSPATSKSEDQWVLSGKIGMLYPQPNCSGNDCRLQSDQGGIRWQQQKERYEITLIDPFGRELLRLAGDNRQLTATAAGKEPLETSPDSFAQLLTNQPSQQQLFADVTPKDLRYWVTGRPSPQHSAKQNNGSFEQKGFLISASQWRETNVGEMPSLVVLKKAKMTLRLVIKSWESLEKR